MQHLGIPALIGDLEYGIVVCDLKRNVGIAQLGKALVLLYELLLGFLSSSIALR